MVRTFKLTGKHKRILGHICLGISVIKTAKLLGIRRTNIWKQIKVFEREGYIKIIKKDNKNIYLIPPKGFNEIKDFISEIPIKPPEPTIYEKKDSCEICGFGKKESLVVHHKKMISEGGTNEPSNLQTVCANCHLILHAKNRRPKHSHQNIHNAGVHDTMGDLDG